MIAHDCWYWCLWLCVPDGVRKQFLMSVGVCKLSSVVVGDYRCLSQIEIDCWLFVLFMNVYFIWLH